MAITDRFPSLPNNEATGAWLEQLQAAPGDAPDVEWPDEAEFVERLRYVDIPEEDIAVLQGLYPRMSADAEMRWVIERYLRLLRSRMNVPGYEPLPALPADPGEIGLHLFTFVHVAFLPETLAFHRERGIPDAISRATMADIGRHYLIERTERYRSGLNGGDRWLTFHARGLIYQLGRLQFERATIGNRSSQSVRDAGIPCAQGDPVLSVHIPGFMGAFPPEACDASFAQARAFFATHFPEVRYRIATCHSWLLDPQLAGYLPETSNIVQFQRRFRTPYNLDPGNEDTLGFVFRSPGTPLDELPQRTTLERAVVQHIRNGSSWNVGHAWLDMDEQ